MVEHADVIIANPCGITGEIVSGSLQSHGLKTMVITGPSARKDEPGFIRTMKNAAAESGAGMIIPIFFPEVLAAHKEEFPGIVIPVDSPEHIRLLDDKISACELVAGLGIPQPRRYGSAEEVEHFPVVFKRPCGQGGDSVYFPKTAKALRNLLRTADRWLITDYIDGFNCCVDALRFDGLFKASAYRVLEPLGKGVSTKRAIMEAPALVDYARRILDAVDYRGVCGFDFRVDAQGSVFFLEANPRFSGGLPTTIEAGLDLPWELYQCFRGNGRT